MDMVGTVILLIALSPLEVALRSLILPGWGEASLGQNPRVFWLVEGGIGLAAFWGDRQAERYEDQARMLALRLASVEGKIDPSFFNLAEGYQTWEDYRDDLYLQARERYPDNLDAQHRFVQERLPSYTWQWPDQKTWFQYGDLRGLSRSWGNRRRIFLGFLLMNHVVSALNAYFLAKEHPLHLSFEPNPEEIRLRLSYRFP